MTRRPEDALRDALAQFQLMQEYARRDLSDQLVVDAVCLRLSAGIEALGYGCRATGGAVRRGVAADVGDAEPHRLGYLLIDAAIVRRTMDVDIPPIVDRVRRELD